MPYYLVQKFGYTIEIVNHDELKTKCWRCFIRINIDGTLNIRENSPPKVKGFCRHLEEMGYPIETTNFFNTGYFSVLPPLPEEEPTPPKEVNLESTDEFPSLTKEKVETPEPVPVQEVSLPSPCPSMMMGHTVPLQAVWVPIYDPLSGSFMGHTLTYMAHRPVPGVL